MRPIRAQEQRPCEHAPLGCDDIELPWRCVGCDRDGTRWVTVGTLREDQPGWHGDSALYVIEASS